MKITIDATSAMTDGAERIISDQVESDFSVGNLDKPALTVEQALAILVIEGLVAKGFIKHRGQAYG